MEHLVQAGTMKPPKVTVVSLFAYSTHPKLQGLFALFKILYVICVKWCIWPSVAQVQTQQTS